MTLHQPPTIKILRLRKSGRWRVWVYYPRSRVDQYRGWRYTEADAPGEAITRALRLLGERLHGRVLARPSYVRTSTSA